MTARYRTFSRTALTIAVLNMSATLLTGFSVPANNSQLRRWASSLVRGETFAVTLDIDDARVLRHTGLALKRFNARLDIYLDLTKGHAAIHGRKDAQWVLDDEGFELRIGSQRYPSTPEDALVARALLSGFQNGLWGCTGADERGAPFFPAHDEIAERVLCPPGIIPGDRDVQLLFRTRGKWQELEGLAIRTVDGWHTALVVDQEHGGGPL